MKTQQEIKNRLIVYMRAVSTLRKLILSGRVNQLPPNERQNALANFDVFSERVFALQWALDEVEDDENEKRLVREYHKQFGYEN